MSQICRTCFQETSTMNFFEIANDPKSIQIKTEMRLCIPEIDLNILGSSGLCTLCVAALDASYRFKMQCLYTEERIRSYLNATKSRPDTKILDVYKSINSFGLVSNRKGAAVTEPTRNYIDDLNDLLDDALSSKDVGSVFDTNSILPHPITIKKERESPERSIPEVIKKPLTKTVENQHSSRNVENPPTLHLKCKVCKFEAPSGNALRAHVAKHKSFRCDMCSFTTGYESSLRVHLELHQTRKVSTCSQCDYKTLNEYMLKKHTLDTHTTNKQQKARASKRKLTSSLACDSCNYCTDDKLNLEQHKKNHLAIRKCEHCDFTTDNKFKYAGHCKLHKSK